MTETNYICIRAKFNIADIDAGRGGITPQKGEDNDKDAERIS